MADISLFLSLVNGKQKAVDLSSSAWAFEAYELKSDTINESGSAAGVTIDGLQIKDGKLVTADSVVAANITNEIILNEHIGTSAAIALSKLAAGSPSQIIVGAETTGLPSFATMSGDATISFSGALSIGADKIGADKIRLANNAFLRARNAANDADVNILKVNASDIIEFASFPISPSAAPDADYEMANKKYVDDQIGGAVVGAMIYKGVFDASAGNYDAITNPEAGWFYKVSVAGTAYGKATLISQGILFTSKIAGTAGNAYSFAVIDSASGGLSYTEVAGEIIVDLGGSTTSRAQLITHMTTTDPSEFVDVTLATAGADIVVASEESLAGGDVGRAYALNDNMYLNKDVIGHPSKSDIDLIDNTEAADLLRNYMLASGQIFVGNVSNVAVAATVTGDVTISNTGETAIASGVIVNNDLSASAAIALSKLAAGASEAQLILTAATTFAPTYVSQSGDVSVSSAGVFAIASGAIVNDDINASAGIVDTKLATISTASKVSGSAVQLNAAGALVNDTGLKVSVDASTIEINGSNQLAIKLGGVQKSYVYFLNNTNATLSAGTLVGMSQSTAGELIVSDASALSTAESYVGVVVADILDDASGFIQVSGEATIAQTAAFDLGKEVFLSEVAGQGIKTAPTTQNACVVCIGIASATNKVVLHRDFRYEIA